MSGLKNGRSFDRAVPPRTWPTHYGPVSPRCPRTAVNSQRSPPATTCEHEAWAGFEPASNAREHPRNALIAGYVACPVGNGRALTAVFAAQDPYTCREMPDSRSDTNTHHR